MLLNCGVGEDSWESWDTFESALDSKEIQPVNPQGNQPWIFIGRTDAQAQKLWPPDVKNWLIRKEPDAGKYLGQEKWAGGEDDMVGWHHRLNGHELEHTPENGGQGGLACCSPWGHKYLDTTSLWIQQQRALTVAGCLVDLRAQRSTLRKHYINHLRQIRAPVILWSLMLAFYHYCQECPTHNLPALLLLFSR